MSRNRRIARRLLSAVGGISILASLTMDALLVALIDGLGGGPREGVFYAAGLMISVILCILSIVPIAWGIICLDCSRRMGKGGRAAVIAALVMVSLQIGANILAFFYLLRVQDLEQNVLQFCLWGVWVAITVPGGFLIYFLIRVLGEKRIEPMKAAA